jgi:hypothetical protein
MNKEQITKHVHLQLEMEELKYKWLNDQITTEEFLREKSVIDSEKEYQKSLGR